ncbi:hypothetical protein SeMB42_g06920 [Synchytrium endobioticum]|uniref:Uncharacterized protein n=1 Tax=Synchytrium endobioticum TaxID=286115 RepID=A0A507CZN8_9FUNG|nr:hypothetical protein SeMB42_g06920 [Synchytrium endobioticum]TPX44652.1 hypothetical protein SeLEV6574_g04366 [Synchytrium endobioticum]
MKYQVCIGIPAISGQLVYGQLRVSESSRTSSLCQPAHFNYVGYEDGPSPGNPVSVILASADVDAAIPTEPECKADEYGLASRLFGLQGDSLDTSQLQTVEAPNRPPLGHHQLKKRFYPEAPTPSNNALQQPRPETATRARVTRPVASHFRSLDDPRAMLSTLLLYCTAILLAAVGLSCAFHGILRFMFWIPSPSSLREYFKLIISMLLFFGSYILVEMACQELEKLWTRPRSNRGGQNPGGGYRLEDEIDTRRLSVSAVSDTHGPLANLDRRRSVALAPRRSGGRSPASSYSDLRR